MESKMNNVYKRLAQEATEYCKNLDNGIPWIWEEKYAQLIMEECITVMVTHDYHGTWLGEQIKEHFGVKDSRKMICPKCGIDRSKAACPEGETATLTKQCPMVSESQ